MTVLVAYDATPSSRRALEIGIQEAELRRAPLHVVRVLTHEVGDSPTRVRADMVEAESEEEELDAIRARLTASGLEVTTALLHALYGEAGHQVVDETRRIGAELVVIGTRHRSRVGKLLLGSVAQDVLLGVDCPVLAVKAPAARSG
jgi:nucleotide-binding universal stress UspA family protein